MVAISSSIRASSVLSLLSPGVPAGATAVVRAGSPSVKDPPVVGISFVPTDLPVESLFRVALAKDPALKSLVIANPSREHRRRVREVFAKSLERGAVVRQYESFEDFVAAFPDCWG